MITGLKFNPITGSLDLISKIPELSSDPASPKAEDVWVLRSGQGSGIADGTPIGLLLALTYYGNVGGAGFTYQLSYRNQSGATVRATIS